jgi:hypothetical protein
METSVSEFEEASQPSEFDATRATARLPGLDIEIIHRRAPAGDAEQISINLQAAPSFEAFGRFLGTANPFAFWMAAAQLAWSARGRAHHSAGKCRSISAERSWAFLRS